MAERTCSIEGCERPGKGRGWCELHYDRWRRHGDPLAIRLIVGDDVRRFWSKVDLNGPDGCYLWTGTMLPGGYGTFGVNGKSLKPHRYAYELLVGPIPGGLVLDHVCHNEAVRRGDCAGGPCLHRRCVNVAHLEAKTHGENSYASPLYRGNVTHCPKGHEYTRENTRMRVGRKRSCRECDRLYAISHIDQRHAQQKLYRERRKAQRCATSL